MISIMENICQAPISEPLLCRGAPISKIGAMAKKRGPSSDDGGDDRADDGLIIPKTYPNEWIAHGIRGRKIEQKEVARRMGVADSTVSKLLSGEMAWKEHYIARFARAMEIDFFDFWRHPDNPSQADVISEAVASALQGFSRNRK